MTDQYRRALHWNLGLGVAFAAAAGMLGQLDSQPAKWIAALLLLPGMVFFARAGWIYLQGRRYSGGRQARAVAARNTKDLVLPPLTLAAHDRVQSFTSRQSWGISDPARFNALMDEAMTLVQGGIYLGDNLFTWLRNISVLEDAAFRRAWAENITNTADEAILWRRYILCCAAYHCIQLEGDFVECGVLYGTGVKTVIDYFGKNEFRKTYWAYDTFDTTATAGHALPQPERLFEKVQARFEGYQNVNLVRGFLPASLIGNSPDRIALLHIDLNNADSEIAVLEALFERMVPGGIIVLDDYEWAGVYRDQKIREDSWFDQRRYRVLALPTGQGIVLKR